MPTGDAGIARIKRFESYCATVCRCTAGKRTNGYAHVVLPGELFGTITDAEANARTHDGGIHVAAHGRAPREEVQVVRAAGHG